MILRDEGALLVIFMHDPYIVRAKCRSQHLQAHPVQVRPEIRDESAPRSCDFTTNGLRDNARLLPRGGPVLVSLMHSAEWIQPGRNIAGREYAGCAGPSLPIADDAIGQFQSRGRQPFDVG